MAAAPKAQAGARAIKSYDCSLLPGAEVLCGSGTTTSAYADIRISYTWKRYNHAIGAKAVRCTGGDLGPWVQLVTRGHIYRLVSSIPNGGLLQDQVGSQLGKRRQGVHLLLAKDPPATSLLRC
jgi:hypothetical protein